LISFLLPNSSVFSSFPACISSARHPSTPRRRRTRSPTGGHKDTTFAVTHKDKPVADGGRKLGGGVQASSGAAAQGQTRRQELSEARRRRSPFIDLVQFLSISFGFGRFCSVFQKYQSIYCDFVQFLKKNPKILKFEFKPNFNRYL
jgi:hypothetical protein